MLSILRCLLALVLFVILRTGYAHAKIHAKIRVRARTHAHTHTYIHMHAYTDGGRKYNEAGEYASVYRISEFAVYLGAFAVARGKTQASVARGKDGGWAVIGGGVVSLPLFSEGRTRGMRRRNGKRGLRVGL